MWLQVHRDWIDDATQPYAPHFGIMQQTRRFRLICKYNRSHKTSNGDICIPKTFFQISPRHKPENSKNQTSNTPSNHATNKYMCPYRFPCEWPNLACMWFRPFKSRSPICNLEISNHHRLNRFQPLRHGNIRPRTNQNPIQRLV